MRDSIEFWGCERAHMRARLRWYRWAVGRCVCVTEYRKYIETSCMACCNFRGGMPNSCMRMSWTVASKCRLEGSEPMRSVVRVVILS
jgi:hypothetical protein